MFKILNFISIPYSDFYSDFLLIILIKYFNKILIA